MRTIVPLAMRRSSRLDMAIGVARRPRATIFLLISRLDSIGS